MDQLEAAKVLHERIRSLEPEDFSTKLVGYILQNYPKQEMIRLALGPNEFIQKLIEKAKAEFRLLWTPTLSPPISPSMSPPLISDHYLQFAPFSPASPLPYASPVSFGMCNPFGKRQVLVGGQQGMHKFDCQSLAYPGMGQDELRLHNHFMNVENQLECSDFSGDFYPNGDPEGPRNAVKTCHYFNKGFCKHGSNCRYVHGQQFSESCLHGFENAIEDQVLSPRSLEKLELEITDLLKSRRGNPISIASLPLMYYEKYGRTLQAEGYLTESQRHGKAGFSLTRLLARLKNILLIERPHGQHSVILAEDAAKFSELRGERNDPGPIVSGSRQIYLTFPAESTFTVADVYNYFDTFGAVQDVRIPCQQKRMFGFVTFASADTVKMILSKGNPHYVCGARVLVKPYREKSKLVERKYQAQLEPPMCFHLDDLNMESECHGGWSLRLQKEQLMQEQEHALELEARRLSQLCLAKKPLPSQSCFGERSLEDLKLTEDSSKFLSAESSLCPGDGDDVLKNLNTECTDPERSDGLNLPDSPFEIPVASSMASVM